MPHWPTICLFFSEELHGSTGSTATRTPARTGIAHWHDVAHARPVLGRTTQVLVPPYRVPEHPPPCAEHAAPLDELFLVAGKVAVRHEQRWKPASAYIPQAHAKHNKRAGSLEGDLNLPGKLFWDLPVPARARQSSENNNGAAELAVAATTMSPASRACRPWDHGGVSCANAVADKHVNAPCEMGRSSL